MVKLSPNGVTNFIIIFSIIYIITSKMFKSLVIIIKLIKSLEKFPEQINVLSKLRLSILIQRAENALC